MPRESHPTTDGARATVRRASGDVHAESSADLDGDMRCDFDGARLEIEEKVTAPDGATYSVRRCASDPGHTKRVRV